MLQRGRRKKEVKSHSSPFHLLSGRLNVADQLGDFGFRMSADIGDSNPTTLCFDLRDSDEVHSLMMMKVLSHQNVLHLRAVQEYANKPTIAAHKDGKEPTIAAQEDTTDSTIAAYVDPFTGTLHDLFCLPGFVLARDSVLPSQCVQTIVSEIIDGVDYIRECGYYHGNLSLKSTLYLKHNSGYTVKLSNFQLKGSKGDLKKWQMHDWIGLGHLLTEISDIAKSLDGRQFQFHLIDDLAEKLKSFSFVSLETVKGEVLDNPFFWDSGRRKLFYISDIPRALREDSTFVTRIHNIPSIVLPWNTDSYDGYLTDMFAYRDDNNITAYDENDAEDYVKCMSGMYTHEMLYKENKPKVDKVVQSRNSRLCLDLKNAMR